MDGIRCFALAALAACCAWLPAQAGTPAPLRQQADFAGQARRPHAQ